MLAQFEQSHSCVLFKISKHLREVKMLETQIELPYDGKLLDENSHIHDLCCDWSCLGACSDVALKNHTSITSGSLP